MSIFGVDLGTACARAAVCDPAGPHLLVFSDGSPALPAVVAFGAGAVRLGHAAVEKAAIHPEVTVRGVKRLLGRAAADPIVASIARFATYRVEPRADGALAISVDGTLRDPEDVAAALFAHLAAVAAEQDGARPAAAVLSAPPWFGARQRQALVEAARRAGLEVPQILGEGAAIALSLALAEPTQRRVAIADVGAGGVTVTIAETGPDRVVVLGCAGDAAGGGDDVDRGLLASVLAGLHQRWGDFPDLPATNELLRQTCERIKRDLDEVSDVRAIIPFLPVGRRGLRKEEIRFDRAHLEVLLGDTRARVEAAGRAALAQAALGPDQLAAVYAGGGFAHAPGVRAAIERVLGKISSRHHEPDGAVALGAALQAGMLAGLVTAIPVVDARAGTVPPPPLPASIPPAEVRTAPPPAHGSEPSPTPLAAPAAPRAPTFPYAAPVPRPPSSTPRAAPVPHPPSSAPPAAAAPRPPSSAPRAARNPTPPARPPSASRPDGTGPHPALDVASVTEAYREAERHGDVRALEAALDGYAAERIAAGDPQALFDAITHLATSFEAAEGPAAAAVTERELTRAMLPRARLEALFHRLGEITLPASTARALARALSLLGEPSPYDLARTAYWSGRPALRDALLPYLVEAGAGHEGALGKILRDGDLDHALAALRRLVELATVPARAALEAALDSALVEVRVAAAAHLPEIQPDKVRADLTRVLADPDPELRLRALHAIARHGLIAAGPILVRRIHEGLGAAPLPERKALLETLAALNPRRAEGLALDLLAETHLLPSHDVDETRLIAVELLGALGGPEALPALRHLAARRWLTGAAVREAAAAAIDAINARHPPPAGPP